MTPEEFNFVINHPGGFDRQFYLQNLVHLWIRYLAEHGYQPEETQLVVVLESAEELGVLNARPALTWVELVTDEGELRIVPMAAVRQVKIRRRQGPAAPVGFTVTPVRELEEEQQAIEE